ncbi:MAG: c-type cytochrome [Trueperaceae bacterium]|nr:c-type cytochrome [Trueperaceae bacterium]
MTAVLIALLALALAALILLPLAVPGQADPLPDERDPLLQDLEEERDALLAAIRELDARHDLSDARRSELRARYEAKAAKVLRALDERRAELEGRWQPRAAAPTRRAPWGLVGLLAVSVGIAATLGGYVLPRVGQGTLTTAFQEDLDAAERIRDLRQAAQAAPSGETWAALGDAYWRLEDADGAEEAYRTAVEEHDDAPARAYQRLGLLALREDMERARVLLEQARTRAPQDPNTLGTLGELYFATGDYAAARQAYADLAATEEGAGDAAVEERLAQLDEITARAEAVDAEPTLANQLALAEALWAADARSLAADAYLRVLREFDPEHPTALARVGELLFLSDRNDDALAMLSRARDAAQGRLAPLPENALLFLGNAAFSAEDYDLAIDAWEDHLRRTDDPGRVPGLIERARALRDGDAARADVSLPRPGVPGAGGAPSPAPEAGPGNGEDLGPRAEGEPRGARLFAENCAECHGQDGGGGIGPRLSGNRNAGRPANVESLIRFGRGTMPGFAASLSEGEIEVLRDYVVATFGP